MKVSAVVPAAGAGQRLPGLVEKPYLYLGNKPILAWTIERLSSCQQIDEIIIVVSPVNIGMCQEKVVSQYNFAKVKKVVPGGPTRSESVYNGLQKINPAADMVLIHDGVRPFVSPDIVSLTLEAGQFAGAAVSAVPVVSTVKRVKKDMTVQQTIDRQNMVMVQTPQAFKKDLIMRAHTRAQEKDFQATDDAGLVEWLGQPVQVVMGSYINIKITTPDDLMLARGLLDEMR